MFVQVEVLRVLESSVSIKGTLSALMGVVLFATPCIEVPMFTASVTSALLCMSSSLVSSAAVKIASRSPVLGPSFTFSEPSPFKENQFHLFDTLQQYLIVHQYLL
jgi:hypothetical protein